MEDILKRLNEIFIDVLDNKNIKLTRETTAADVEEWDSLNHIHLVVEIENHYNISFTSGEMQNWKTVGDLCDNIAAKLK